jgi:multiple sugar transport system ATP-binding protein
MSGISIHRMNKSYEHVHVLRDIDLNVEPGEFIVLLGPSGCGKSTLLNAVAGLDEISSGEIRIKGVNVSNLDPSRRGIAMVFQSYALYPTMTVRRNMSFGLRVAGTPKAEIEKQVSWAAELLQLTSLLDRKPSALSGGQRQRVAIGRALVRQADVYLFDEPLSNLDAKLRTEMRVELKKLHKSLGCTILYVTHDQVEAMTLASRIAVMNKGVVEQFADPATIYDRPASLFVAGFVGSPAMNFLKGRLVATDHGLAVEAAEYRLPVGSYGFKQDAGLGTEVVLGVRPEDIRLGPPSVGEATVEAEPSFIEPMGADTLAWFDLAGHRLSVRLQPQQARQLSGLQTLHFDVSKASLFSAATERRL